MDPNRSHITLLVDRTGSMQSIRTDAEGAVNRFIEDQKQEPLPCTLLMVEFDNPGNAIDLHTVHDGDLKTAPAYKLNPRGNTPLLDAIGMTIVTTGERLAAMAESDRPGHVFFVIQTDGHENASRDWRLEKVIEAIKRQEDEFSWTFIFLGSGPDGFASSRMFAGTQMADAHTVQHASTGDSYFAAYAGTSSNLRSARAGAQGVKWGGQVDADGNPVDEKAEPAKK